MAGGYNLPKGIMMLLIKKLWARGYPLPKGYARAIGHNQKAEERK